MAVKERKDRKMYGLIKAYMFLTDIGTVELAAALRMSESTLLRRLKNPERLTVGEVRKIQEKLKIPMDDMKEVLMKE